MFDPTSSHRHSRQRRSMRRLSAQEKSADWNRPIEVWQIVALLTEPMTQVVVFHRLMRFRGVMAAPAAPEIMNYTESLKAAMTMSAL